MEEMNNAESLEYTPASLPLLIHQVHTLFIFIAYYISLSSSYSYFLKCKMYLDHTCMEL